MFASRIIFLVYVFIWNTESYAGDVQSCSPQPLQEGRPGKLNCNITTTGANMTWQVQSSGVYVDLVSCDERGSCLSFADNYSATIQTGPGDSWQNMQLTISSAHWSQSIFKCVVAGIGERVCSLQVFVKPDTPNCSQPEPYSTSEVAVSCQTLRVYPEAVCEFSYLAHNVLGNWIARVEYKSQKSPFSPDLLSTTCTLILDVSGMKPGNYQFSLNMFPRLTQVPSTAIASIDPIPSINLAPPSVSLSPSCPTGSSVKDGYIDARYFSSTTCACHLQEPGLPPGRAQWFRFGSALNMTGSQDGSSNLSLTFNITDTEPSFECRGVSVLNTSSSLASYPSYRPLYAFGPSSVLLTQTHAVYDLCPSNNQNVTVTCATPSQEVNPAPSLSIYINSNVVQRSRDDLTQPRYSLSFSFLPLEAGPLIITCRAENSVFPEVLTSKDGQLLVREPPMSQPKISLVTSESAQVEAGSNVFVDCLVEGGNPPVDWVVLDCGLAWSNKSGPRASLEFKASMQLKGQVCYCWARHATDCYSFRSRLVLELEVVSAGDQSSLPLTVGLSVGLGLTVLVLVIVVVLVLVYRHKKRRATPSAPPTYVSGWLNNGLIGDKMDDHHYLSSSLRYVKPPEYAPPEPPVGNLYYEITPPPDYITPADLHEHPPVCLTRGKFNADYIQPLA